MQKFVENLYIGNDEDCANARFLYVIHACKTCHQKALGYSKSLPNTDNNYLIYSVGVNLYLNVVDMPQEFSPKYTHPIMAKAMQFIEATIQRHRILVHCNKGYSRSPSIALVYLARKNVLSSNSYIEAKAEFKKLYSEYNPGTGIDLYLKNNWKYLMEMAI